MLIHHAPLAKLALVVVATTACRGSVDPECLVKSRRTVDWDRAPKKLGFSADDLMASLPSAIQIKVRHGYGSAPRMPIDDVDSPWWFSYEPRRDERPIFEVMHRPQGCWAMDLYPDTGLRLGVPVEMSVDARDGTWRFDGEGMLYASELWPSTPNLEIAPLMGMRALLHATQLHPNALDRATQTLRDREVPEDRLPVAAIGALFRGYIAEPVAALDGYDDLGAPIKPLGVAWYFDLQATGHER
jgi:hypothetical protein